MFYGYDFGGVRALSKRAQLTAYCRGVGTAHMQEDLKDLTEVVLSVATNCRYT
jgi:hypothetical protein